MKIKVLGSSAGGGFPQWNCSCPNCEGVRNGSVRALPRTQSSIAVSGNATDWVLFNASPDILSQIKATPILHSRRALRDTGIAAVVLIDAQIDHTTGLLMLREGKPLQVYCTRAVRDDLVGGNPIFDVLSHYCTVTWHPVPTGPGSSFAIPGIEGLSFTAVSLRSKAPPYSPHREDPHEGDNIGVRVEDARTGKNLFYAPGLGEIERHVMPYLENADCLMVDGTFWTEDEMVKLGISPKLAREIGHVPQSGADGMISVLRPLDRPRKILIHINNTNPILNEDSNERAELDAAGIEVAFDGMEIDL